MASNNDKPKGTSSAKSKARRRKRGEPERRSPLASPGATILLVAMLVVIGAALILEGPNLFPQPSATPVTPSATATPTQGGEGASPEAVATPTATPFQLKLPWQTAAPTLRMHTLAVGKADCFLLECGGETLLVDGGDTEDAPRIIAYLEQQGIKTLDYVVNTHPHKDHLGGLAQIVERFTPKAVYLSPARGDSDEYERFLLAMDAAMTEQKIPLPGYELELGKAMLTFLAPAADADFGNDENNWSLVFRITYGDTAFLFMGDAENKAEKALLETDYDLKADVLKVAHHGEGATKQTLLDRVQPKFAIVTCDTADPERYPDTEVLDRLREAGAQVFLTDESGDFVLESDGSTVTQVADA